MTDASDTPTPADEPTGSARDYIKAFLLIAVIVALVIVFWMFMIGAGPFCDCGTKPAV